MNIIIELNNIVKSFKENIVLNGITLNIEKNDVIYIHGPNGCGKSTLLKIIAGLLLPDEGSVLIKKNEEIGGLIENPEFSDYSTIKENLEYLYNLKHRFDYEKVQKLCQDFDLDLNDKKIIKKYSIGMKQKMGIVQAVMENQSIILLDEPTRGLDEKSIKTYKKMMTAIIKEHKTVIVTSHDFVDIGFNRVLSLEHGKLNES